MSIVNTPSILEMDNLHVVSDLIDDVTLKRLRYFPRALQAVLYVMNHIDETIRLDHVAQLSGMAPGAFSRFFSEKIGVSFSALVKRFRIMRAVQALENGDCAIATLAEVCGYQSCCTFSRAFKEIVGCTPSEYRRRFLSSSV